MSSLTILLIVLRMRTTLRPLWMFALAIGNVGAFTGLSACNAVYIIGRSTGRSRAELLVKEVASLIELLPISPDDIKANLGAGHPDFEDSIQIAAAMAWGADIIITRDKVGFADSPIKVQTPAEFIESLG